MFSHLNQSGLGECYDLNAEDKGPPYPYKSVNVSDWGLTRARSVPDHS